jgi:hypothetical protein
VANVDSIPQNVASAYISQNTDTIHSKKDCPFVRNFGNLLAMVMQKRTLLSKGTNATIPKIKYCSFSTFLSQYFYSVIHQ